MSSTGTPCTGRVGPSTSRPGRWQTVAHRGTTSSAASVSLAVLVYERTLRARPFRKAVQRKSLIQCRCSGAQQLELDPSFWTTLPQNDQSPLPCEISLCLFWTGNESENILLSRGRINLGISINFGSKVERAPQCWKAVVRRRIFLLPGRPPNACPNIGGRISSLLGSPG